MPELFQSFNSFLNIILRKKNAVVVGPHRQLVGEYPEDVTFQRYYEYYHGWDQIKRSVDTEHQKFMGSGMKITSNNEKFDKFIKEWWEITNAEQKFSNFFLSTFITGNGIMERQYTDEGKLGNIEHIPMTTIFKIFRDSWGNEIKLQQIVDGVFMDLDPRFYIHWTINNPDRQAFGKSEFHTLAAPRRITQRVDPTSGQAINPDRTMTSLLDAQAKLQNAEVEIKDKMSKPRIFASFPGMPQDQLAKLEGELSDQNTDKFIWAFNKEASMTEANISGVTKFDKYGENIDQHIDLGTGFGSKVVTNPGSFGYASTQSTIDVLDQRMMSLQAIASEMIKDTLLRPLAESWGFKDFDEYDVQIMFVPTVRRLTMEEVIQLPDIAVSPDEKRALLKDLQIPLDDTTFAKFQKKMQAQQQETPQLPAQASLPEDLIDNFPRPEAEDQIPRPIRNNVSKDYESLEEYVKEMVDDDFDEATARKKHAKASGTSDGAIKAWKKRKRGGGKDEDEDLQKQHDKLGDKIESLYDDNNKLDDKIDSLYDKMEELRLDDFGSAIPKSKWSDKKLALYDKLKQKYAELSRKDKENDKEIDKLEKMQDKIQSRIDAKPDSDLNISNRRHQAEYEDALNNTKFGEYVEDYMGGFKTVSVKGGTNSMASLKPTKITMPKEKIRFGDHTGTMFFKIQQGNELLEPHFITFNKLSKASRNNKAYQKIRSELTLKAKDLNQNMYGGVMDLTDYIAGNFDVFYKHGVTGGIDDMSQYNQSSEDKELAEDWLNEVVDILGVDLDHIDPSDFVETHAPDLLEDYGKDDYDDEDMKINERMEYPPNRDPDYGEEPITDLYSIRPTQGKPSVTDNDISRRITGKKSKKTVAQPYTPANTILPDGTNSTKYNHVTKRRKIQSETINMPPDNTRPTVVKKTKQSNRKF